MPAPLDRRPSATPFRLEDLDYELPQGRIADHPAPRREDARLLYLNRSTGELIDSHITDLPALLEPADLLVLNDTRVLPARFYARRATGGRVPGLFLAESQSGSWHVLLQGSARLRVGEVLALELPPRGGAGEQKEHEPSVPPASPLLVAAMTLEESRSDGEWTVRVDPHAPAADLLDRYGRTPLPPYIDRKRPVPGQDVVDRLRYQTVYARSPGAIAAPTAGLHFTQRLLEQIGHRGVPTAYVTLHVGVGTFKPIAAARLEDHRMHEERFELPRSTAEAIHACRDRGGRVLAVGTTTVRVLESSVAADTESSFVQARTAATSLFIYPPFRFRMVDALLTNFHLPRSTLLALVMAFCGVENTRRAYRHAIDNGYRFYSFGDAMLIQ